MIYKVWLYFKVKYDDIEADCEEEALEIAREKVIEDDDWWYKIEKQWYETEKQEEDEE